jgi:hypothetical protein
VPSHFLLQSQRNDVFAAIQEAGLNPAEFEWEERTSHRAHGNVPVLVHRPSHAHFVFDFDFNRAPEQHVAEYMPGLDRPRDERSSGSWESQLVYVKSWLVYLKREWHAPNLWAELSKQKALFASDGGEVANTPFTRAEQAEITRELAEIKAYVRKTYKLSESQYEAFNARLDYFEEAASRLGRIDWRNAFVGAFVGAVMQAVIPPEPVQDALNLVLRGLGQLFGVSLPELPR